METLYNILNNLDITTHLQDSNGGIWNKNSMLPFFPKEQLNTPATIYNDHGFQYIRLETGQRFHILNKRF